MNRSTGSLISTLKAIRLFSEVSDTDLSSLVRFGNHVVYRKQRHLCYQSEQVDRVSLVISGKYTRLKYRADESCVVLGSGGAGDWLGLVEYMVPCPNTSPERYIRFIRRLKSTLRI